ncbi:hypothetical protein [Thiolapillus sp.]
MAELSNAFIIAGGVFTSGLVIFHCLFWRIFHWPTSLRCLNSIDRATMQVMNLAIIAIFIIIAYISFAHTAELANTRLGKSLLAAFSLLWLFRAALQAPFYSLGHPASAALAATFLCGAFFYGAPLFIQ